jgi:uncharacterized protein involved in exopolysaccharide biosynthesis
MAAEHRDGSGNSIDLVVFLWKQRRLLIGITLLGAIAGVIASFVIREKFRGEVILYPAISNSASRSLLNEQSGSRDDILALGDEEDAQQLLQMLQSDEIRDRTTAKYDLMTVYRIDPQGSTKRAELREAYEDHVSFEFTKFGSVRIDVMDEDPQRAADMANFIASEVDSVWNTMQMERASIGVRLVESKLEEAEHNVAWLNDSLGRIRAAGVQDYHTQSERFNEYLGAAIVKGDDRAIRLFDEKFKILAQYGGAYLTLQGQLDNELWRLNQLRTKLTQARADMESELPHKFIVNRALAADKKAYPVRWLVTAISTASAFLLALLFLIVRENLRKLPSANG